MGLSRAEFLRIFARAHQDRAYQVDGNAIILAQDGRRVRISLAAQAERVIASVRLPTILVEFHFAGYTRGEVEQFMKRFDLYFHRGGG